MITTSAVLVTLLVGLITRLVPGPGDHLPEAPLIAATISFTTAAVLALAMNAPLGYEEADVDGLRKGLDQPWLESEAEVTDVITRNRLQVLESAKRGNTWKALLLLLALTAEATAIGFLTWAMFVVV